jgi:hypothetical protein
MTVHPRWKTTQFMPPVFAVICAALVAVAVVYGGWRWLFALFVLVAVPSGAMRYLRDLRGCRGSLRPTGPPRARAYRPRPDRQHRRWRGRLCGRPGRAERPTVLRGRVASGMAGDGGAVDRGGPLGVRARPWHAALSRGRDATARRTARAGMSARRFGSWRDRRADADATVAVP